MLNMNMNNTNEKGKVGLYSVSRYSCDACGAEVAYEMVDIYGNHFCDSCLKIYHTIHMIKIKGAYVNGSLC